MGINRKGWIALLLIAALSLTTYGQGKKGPTTEDIEACQAELDDALQKKAASNETMQAVYSRSEQIFEKLKTGEAKLAIADIERVLGSAATEARNAFARAKREKARNRSIESFGKAAMTEMARLENSALKRVSKTVAATALAVWQEGAAENKLPSNTDLATIVFQRITGETPFWQLWNDEVADAQPETAVWVTRCTLVEDLQQKLMILKDPKMAFTLNAPKGMARIPGAAVIVEGLYGYTFKKRSVRVRTFLIDRHEVSHGDYWRSFHTHITDAKNSQLHLPQDRDGNPLWAQNPETGSYEPTEEQMVLPVVGIDLRSASAYATKVGKRLPTEAEWLLGASGSERGQARFPTGDKPIAEFINHKPSGHGGPLAVGTMPEGRSQYGLYHVAGNVAEWTWTVVEKGKDIKGTTPGSAPVVVRGGSFDSTLRMCSTRARWAALPVGTHDVTLGFRCAKDDG